MKNFFYAILAIVVFYVQNGITEETDAELKADGEDHALSRVRRGGLSMLRLGRGLQMLRLGKRSLPLMRLGRSSPSEYDGQSDLDFLVYSLLYNYDRDFRNRKQAPVPRYGRDLYDYLGGDGYAYAPPSEIRPPPRLGRFKRSMPDSSDDDKITRAEPVPSIGRWFEEKAVPVPRFGRLTIENDGYDKRSLAMMRLGRAGLNTLRLGRRALPMMRLGKRPLNTLRLGKREDDLQNEVDKRLLNVLRLGKRGAPQAEASEKVAKQAD